MADVAQPVVEVTTPQTARKTGQTTLDSMFARPSRQSKEAANSKMRQQSNGSDDDFDDFMDDFKKPAKKVARASPTKGSPAKTAGSAARSAESSPAKGRSPVKSTPKSEKPAAARKAASASATCTHVGDDGSVCSKKAAKGAELCTQHKPKPAPKATKGKEPMSSVKSAGGAGGAGANPDAIAVADGAPSLDKSASPAYVKKLAKEFPDTHWADWQEGCIQVVDKAHPVELLRSVDHPGMVFAMSLSDDGSMLLTTSTFGSVRVWDLDTYQMLAEFRDKTELQIEEFYTAKFSPDGKYIFAAGKLKDRDVWCEDDDDNTCIPSAIKVFDVLTGNVQARLKGHTEEIFGLEPVTFRGSPYIATCGQDGTTRRWRLTDDCLLVKMRPMIDAETNMAFDLAFVPDTGNKYLAVAADSGISIFDFERCSRIQCIPDIFSSYCDCVQFIRTTSPFDGYAADSIMMLTRGVELVDDDEKVIHPNSVKLHKLALPESAGAEFTMTEAKRLVHDEFASNVWPGKVASNGQTVVAPTQNGHVMAWDMGSGKLVADLHTHGDKNVRCTLFHPNRPLLISSSDAGEVCIFATPGSNGGAEDTMDTS